MTAATTLLGASLLWLSIWLVRGSQDFTFGENPKFFVSLIIAFFVTCGSGLACLVHAFFS